MDFVDEFGVTRHLLTKEQLNDLYRLIDYLPPIVR